MADNESHVEALIEKGLKLYSQGQLDRALSQWRDVLDLIPDHPRVRDYIKYVEDNRAALEESFRAASSGNYRAVREESGENTSVSSIEQEQRPSFDGETDQWTERAYDPVDCAGGPIREEAPPVGSSAVMDVETTAKIDPGALKNQVEATRTEEERRSPLSSFAPAADLLPTPFITDTERMDKEVLQANVAATKPLTADGGPEPVAESPSNVLPFRSGADWASSPLVPLTLLEGEGELAEDSFEPLERTPVGFGMPEPSRVIRGKEIPTSDMDFLEKTPLFIPSAELVNSLDPTDASVEHQDPAAPPGQLLQQEPTTAERVSNTLSGARQLFEQGTHEGSLWLCERVLSMDPENHEAQTLHKQNQDILLEQFTSAIGDLSAVPVVRVPQHEIMWHKLDHRAGFLLSRIDGQISFEDIIDVSGMERFEASRILHQLLSLGVIGPRR